MTNEAKPIWVSEEFVNLDRDCRFGETEPYESFTDDVGKLFRSLMKEYGRCISKVFIDTKAGVTKAVGWVFLKRDKYEGSQDTYLREVWVTLHNGPATRTVRYDYHELRG